jgi:hypothetical protein
VVRKERREERREERKERKGNSANGYPVPPLTLTTSSAAVNAISSPTLSFIVVGKIKQSSRGVDQRAPEIAKFQLQFLLVRNWLAAEIQRVTVHHLRLRRAAVSVNGDRDRVWK